MRAVLIWIAAGLAGLLALVLLLVIGAGIWLSTPSGRDVILAQAQKAVPGLVVEGADGSIFDLRLARVTMADADGIWLIVTDARLDWTPWPLLGRSLEVAKVGAATVDVARQPLPSPDQTEAGTTPLRLPVSVTVDRLAVGRVTLGAALLGGEPALLTVSGHLNLPSGELAGAGALDIARIDEHPGTLAVSGAYRPGGRLTLAAEATEEGNGLLAELLDIPGRPAVVLTLQGDGTLSDWTGTATAKAGDQADARAEFRIRPVGTKLTFGLDLAGNMQALLPPSIRDLVGPDLKVGAGGLIDPGKLIALDGVGIEAAIGRVSGGGQFDLETRALNVGAWVEVPDAAPLDPMVAPAAFAAARGSLTLTGTPEAPHLATDMVLDRVVLPDLTAATLGIKGVVKAEPGMEKIDVAADMALQGLAGPLATLTGPRATMVTRAVLTPAPGRIDLSQLAFNGTSMTATAKGVLTGWGQDGDLAINMAARNLAPLSNMAGRPLSGAMTAEATVRRRNGETAVLLKGQADGLGVGQDQANALLAGRTELTADITVGAETVLRALSVRTPLMSLTAQGRYGADGITADATAEVPDLSPLSRGLGMEMVGAVTARLRSPVADSLELEVRGDGVVLDGLRLPDTRLDARLANATTAPNGRATLETRLNGQRIAAETNLALADGILEVADLEAVVGINRFTGGLRLDTGTGLASGRFQGTVPDLGILAFIAGDEVWGNGTIDLSLSAEQGRQSLDLKADFKEIWRRWHGQRVATISLAARLDGAGRDHPLDAGFTITGVDAGTLDLDRITGSAQGPLADLALRFDLAGKRGAAPLRLAMAAQLATGAKDGVTRLGLRDLSGTYADTDFHLANPADLAFGEGVVGVDRLVVLAGDARIDLTADLSARGIDGRLALSRVPLNWVRLIDPTLTLYGHIDGSAELSGNVRDPRGTLSLKLTDFAVTPQAQRGPSPIGATLAATWRDGRVALEAHVDSAGSGVGLTARGDLPLVMQGSVTNIAIPTDQPVSGRLEGNLALRRLNDFLASTGDRLGGQMVLDLTLGGTLAERQLSGSVRLENARYENQQWGTQITDIQAVLTGDTQGLSIERFEGRTAGGGTVTVAGSLGLRPELGDRQIDLHLKANRAKLTNVDMVEAIAGADITVTGSLTDVTIAGRVDVQQAYVRMPDKLPSSVVQLKVVEINHPRRVPPPGAVSSADATPEGTPPPKLVIRFNVDIEAPNQIYVSGRGLDAELKASLKLRGTSEAPLVTGGVSLVKGEMALLGQTFTLSRVNIGFMGDNAFDPSLDVSARTQRGELTAIVEVSGRPSKPVVKLSSEPPYPEDEVLARLLFNRGAGQLSALEAVQLAQSAAQLAGLFGSGPGFVDNVKRSLGVDRLEFRGSEDGQGAGTVAAGRYVGDNIYIGVEQELGTGQSKATVEYGITQNIKARGEVGTESKVGIQFEWDY
ncbi:translocation/assembly module TamB domain-containing protein [Niveispirillum fermenti]|uniref:translocation/assembly module TamB domain-containing protein n=1 Tax=Niveispirillum fermenti TaxID=1233113 RepID=UPI003A884C0B